jgi:ribA/ribD-fused uncharacterized protein
MLVGFNKTKDPFGWLGNMSAHPIQYGGKKWNTSEALFQALRFDDEEIIKEIRAKSSPMAAKMCAKKNKAKTVITPLSSEDVENMRLCLKLKFEQHSELARKLKLSMEHELYEDVSARVGKGSALFWGAYKKYEQLIGENILGKLLMELRNQLS